ncbi:hypothetical protein CLG96_16980 [Sphingomonas oleivorans]|uniref:Uncharacterized protein n=1 Tax=Sphingomonas oleivorans TaxID=1735121 RepID=A0A2T5FU77_9SPHN|nr:hypothetical protein [Sphingomonas oleivorans]PTQ07831.1 hypothetical protein CLG96_16980 [Sphingomonas oleivorans]
MIVYGDHAERACPAERIEQIAAELRQIEAMPAGIARHGALVAAFVALARIAQGIADAHFQEVGADGGSPAEADLLASLVELAHAIMASWHGGFAVVSLPKPACPARLPDAVELRRPEGHAFYAVYPEAYALAAARLVLKAPPRVIGIRSIGTGLAAMVAAMLGAPPPLTVRPISHPFRRRIEMASEIAAALPAEDCHYVVVDEGPGLSGSSFAAVAGFLEARNVPRDRIAFLPSHGGNPGAQASNAVRRRWAEAQRPVVEMDELIPPARLAAWVSSLVGPLVAPPEDISGGAWRRHVFTDERDWPAVDPYRERRKFLVRTAKGRWLARFAGIGEGAYKLERARTLHAAGLVPEVRGLVHGFLVERWEEARPLDPAATDAIGAVAHYLGLRTRLLPSPVTEGATLPALFEMAECNIRVGLGEREALRFAARHAPDAALAARAIPVATDNRCDMQEWLHLPDGRILKADALDHDMGHDLVGPQDPAWDVAGAAAEFDLEDERLALLVALLDRIAPRPIDLALLGFFRPCYLAFRLGAARLAAGTLANWPAEAMRNEASAERYAQRLARLLACP